MFHDAHWCGLDRCTVLRQQPERVIITMIVHGLRHGGDQHALLRHPALIARQLPPVQWVIAGMGLSLAGVVDLGMPQAEAALLK